MAAGRGGIASGAGFLLLAATPVLIYRVTRDYAPPWLVYAVAGTQVAVIAWFASKTWTIRYRVAAATGLFGAALVCLAGLPVRTAALAVAGGCHAIAYTGLLIWFAASLRSGREPVVTGLARRVRQRMPDKVVRYTRQVTIAWSAFFAAQLAMSAALLVLAPPSVWSAFINLANLPLLAAMVLGEFGYRVILFRHEPHTGLLGALSALRRVPVSPRGPP
jgi:uncharacterized membrane protein